MAHVASATQRLLLAAAVLPTVTALRARAPPLVPQRPATALCVAGNARTLPRPEVAGSLVKFVQGLPGSGLYRPAPDVFAFVTLQGAGPKGQAGWDFVAENVTHGEVEQALAAISPVRIGTDPNADTVTWDNIDSYVENREACFDVGYWRRTPEGLRRSLNQLAHWQQCLRLVAEHERARARNYSAVVLARPDLSYRPGYSLDLPAVAHDGIFICQKDWVMAMPRRLMGLLLDPRRAGPPLRCSPGQSCCGAVGQSEVLWEYLMGVRVDNRDSCHCGPSKQETGLLEQRTEQPIGSIVRPDRAEVLTEE